MDRFPVLRWSCREHFWLYDNVHWWRWVGLLLCLTCRFLGLSSVLELLGLRGPLQERWCTLLSLVVLRDAGGSRWLSPLVLTASNWVANTCSVHRTLVFYNFALRWALHRVESCGCDLLAPLTRKRDERCLLRLELLHHLVIGLRSTWFKNTLGRG